MQIYAISGLVLNICQLTEDTIPLLYKRLAYQSPMQALLPQGGGKLARQLAGVRDGGQTAYTFTNFLR
jgi:hypothetical protein